MVHRPTGGSLPQHARRPRPAPGVMTGSALVQPHLCIPVPPDASAVPLARTWSQQHSLHAAQPKPACSPFSLRRPSSPPLHSSAPSSVPVRGLGLLQGRPRSGRALLVLSNKRNDFECKQGMISRHSRPTTHKPQHSRRICTGLHVRTFSQVRSHAPCIPVSRSSTQQTLLNSQPDSVPDKEHSCTGPC